MDFLGKLLFQHLEADCVQLLRVKHGAENRRHPSRHGEFYVWGEHTLTREVLYVIGSYRANLANLLA